MKVSKIKISNILGVDEFTFEAGKFNAFTGANGSGKTSRLEAIKAALSGGHDATLLRKGATQGEVVLLLDDGASIRKKVRPTGSDIEYRDKNGVKQPTPLSKIKALSDALSVNPIEFLNAKPEKRAQILLESMPMKADPARLEKIIGSKVNCPDGHAVDVIRMVRKNVFDERTGTNGAAKSKRATANQFRAAIPENLVQCEGDESKLRTQIDSIDADLDVTIGKFQAKLSNIRTKTQAEIDALMAQVNEKKSFLAEQVSKADIAMNSAKNDAVIKKNEIKNQIEKINANRDAIARAKHTSDTILKMDSEAEELELLSKKQTEMIQAIDDYEKELMESLPIKGLEIKDGMIYSDGIPFETLNTAKRVKIAVDIACLRAGEIGLVCVDGLESLDTKSYEAFKAEAMKSNVQMVVTRVSDDDLTVEVD